MESKIIDASITKEWDDSFMLDIGGFGENLYLKEDFNYNKAIMDYMENVLPKDTDFYVLTPGGQIASSNRKECLESDKVIMNQEQLSNVIDSLFFTLSRDHKQCIISSKVSPAKEYVIADWSNDKMVFDYIVNVMGIIVPGTIVMPIINFNDDL